MKKLITIMLISLIAITLIGCKENTHDVITDDTTTTLSIESIEDNTISNDNNDIDIDIDIDIDNDDNVQSNSSIIDNNNDVLKKDMLDMTNFASSIVRSGVHAISDLPVMPKLPLAVELDVDNILQNPELPCGCEVTSLAIVLNYAGYDADKCILADNYLPKWPNLKGDPEYYYLCNPRTDGFYCFCHALITCADNYAKDNNYNLYYYDLTGCDTIDLYREIANGHPVIVWGTLLWGEPKKYDSGLYSNLHCMVLSGYTKDTVTIIDPIYDTDSRTIKREKFEDIWIKMEKHALVVY